MPGVSVTITAADADLSRTALSNESGAYSLTNVPAGAYEVKVSIQGFKEYRRTSVPVSVNEVARVDVQLEVGALSETVTVASATQLLQTDKADTHTELKSEIISQLPLVAEPQLPVAHQPRAGRDAGQHPEQRSRHARARRSAPTSTALRSQQQRDQDRRRHQRQRLAAASHHVQ